ncbi:MAG: hypothetical protein R3E64_09390 [Halioglobus sp.]
METLASLLVGKPQNILVIAIALLVGYLVSRFTAIGLQRRFGSLLIASVAWGVYAAWEWLVQVKTAEANIRVDLLVIWPVLAVLSALALYRVLRSP